jgi:Spy/CpxP family protein refolding chaperone
MTNRHATWPVAGILSGLMILASGSAPGEAAVGRRVAPIERRAIQEQLGLSEDQVKAIREIHSRYQVSMRDIVRALREARHALREMALTEVDEATFAAKAGEARELAGQVLEARARTLQEVARVLTPEQRTKLRELRPMRIHRQAPLAS